MFKRRKSAVDDPRPADPGELVALAYRSVLHRQPDAEGLAAFTAALQDGRDLAWVLEAISASEEHARLAQAARLAAESGPQGRPDPMMLPHAAPPMPVDARCSPDELQLLWDHVARTWSRFGEDDPHWSVLTQEEFRAGAIGPDQLAAFYDSGAHEVDRMAAWLRRAGIPDRPGAVCAEFGCGVGRITHGLARRYDRVLAFDVSAPHLRIAREWMAARGIGNVAFHHLRDRGSLDALQGIDVFFSIISLQHSPPPVILDVLDRAFVALRPGGYAFFQLPTYAADYSYSAAKHVRELSSGEAAAGMEMHFIAQQAVFDLAQRTGLVPVEVQPDGAIGRPGEWISDVFLLRKR